MNFKDIIKMKAEEFSKAFKWSDYEKLNFSKNATEDDVVEAILDIALELGDADIFGELKYFGLENHSMVKEAKNAYNEGWEASYNEGYNMGLYSEECCFYNNEEGNPWYDIGYNSDAYSIGVMES